MTAHYESKHGQVSKSAPELYMSFCDMRSFARLADDKRFEAQVLADYDTLSLTVQGFKIGVKIEERIPYNIIRIRSVESPVEFVAALHFEPSTSIPGGTDFSIVLDANLNFMMKTMLGSKVQGALDKMVDGLVDASNGIMPSGF